MSRSINSRAETMKKTDEALARFKPPFRYERESNAVYDADNTLVAWMCDESGFELDPQHGKLIADALNHYYASYPEVETSVYANHTKGVCSAREQSERKKGEKE